MPKIIPFPYVKGRHFHHCLLPALLIVASSVCLTRADELLTGPRASWEEPGAEVLAFSRDGRNLVTSRWEGRGVSTHLRDAATGRIRAELAPTGVGLHWPRFSPDGRLLFATVSSERHNPVPVFDLKVWHVATGDTYATMPYVAEGLNSVSAGFALSGDGKTLAFMENSERLPIQLKTAKFIMDGRIEVTHAYNANPGLPRAVLWDVPGWKEKAVIDGGGIAVFSPDGKTLVTGSRDWKVPVAKVWNTATQLPLADLVGEAQGVQPMTFSRDGKYLAIGGLSGDPTLWELAAGPKWPLAAGRLHFGAPVFSQDGRVLFPVGMPRPGKRSFQKSQKLPCYDLATLPPRPVHLGDGELIVSPDARRYAVVHGQSGRSGPSIITVHGLPDLSESGRFAVEHLADAGFSPDGRWLLLLDYRTEPIRENADRRFRRRIRLLDADTCRIGATIPTAFPTGWNEPVWAFSPDMKTLAVTYWAGLDEQEAGFERPLVVDLWDVPKR